MQFTADNAALVNALGWVAKALPARPASPVLAGLKLEVADGNLTLSAFDYEQSAVAVIEVTDSTDGVVLVSGKLLVDIARALPKDDVHVSLDGSRVQVKAKTSKFLLPSMPVEDYPTLPTQPETIGSVDANEFAKAISTVVPAAGRDDMLPVLTAVSVKIDPEQGQMTLAATDRFRLAVREIAFDSVPGAAPATLLIPARILDQWAKSLTGESGAKFVFGSAGTEAGVFSVKAGDREATVRVIDGTYPKVQALIPADFNSEIVVSALDLISAVKRVGLVAERSTPASLSFTADGITISASADSEASEDVLSNLVGQELSMGFNWNYLLDGLNAMGPNDVRIALVAPNKPAVLRPTDPEENYTYLLMPMRGV